MAKRKILFVRLGSFSFTNDSLLAQVRKAHPDHEIIDFDVKAALRQKLSVLIIGAITEAWHYGFGVMFDRGRRHDFFFKNPYVFAWTSAFLRRRFTPMRDQIDVVIQTQGLFNASIPGVPLVIYTDYTLKSPNILTQVIPSRLLKQEMQLYHCADAIAVSASHAKTTMIEQYACDESRVHVVYIGSNIRIDFENFDLARYAAQKICFIGIEWGRKGGKYLIDAFLAIAGEFPAATLTIVGSTPPVSHPRIRATGKLPMSAVKEILKESSIFCLPSLVEPSSVAVIEAATAGLPIIASRVGGLVESVEDQATGYLVQPRDVAALAAALRRLLADPARARAMGAAGRKHVLSTFDWEIVGRKFAEIVEAVIAPPTR